MQLLAKFAQLFSNERALGENLSCFLDGAVTQLFADAVYTQEAALNLVFLLSDLDVSCKVAIARMSGVIKRLVKIVMTHGGKHEVRHKAAETLCNLAQAPANLSILRPYHPKFVELASRERSRESPPDDAAHPSPLRRFLPPTAWDHFGMMRFVPSVNGAVESVLGELLFIL